MLAFIKINIDLYHLGTSPQREKNLGCPFNIFVLINCQDGVPYNLYMYIYIYIYIYVPKKGGIAHFVLLWVSEVKKMCWYQTSAVSMRTSLSAAWDCTSASTNLLYWSVLLSAEREHSSKQNNRYGSVFNLKF